MPKTKKEREREREKAIKKFNPPKPKKSKKEKKGKKGKKSKAEGNGQLTNKEHKALSALKKGKELTRKEMAEKTGMKKGWSKMLGATTKGPCASTSLEGREFIQSKRYESSRVLHYTITDKGKKALEAK